MRFLSLVESLRLRKGPFIFYVTACLCTAAQASAQPAPEPQQLSPSAPITPPGSPSEPAATEPANAEAPPVPDTQAEIAALRAELALQKAELERQKEELERQKSDAAAASEATLATLNTPLDTDEYEEKLRFYGFMDMGLQKLWIGESSVARSTVETTASTFVLGNVNLYIDARPLPDWRALAEVRFTNHPHGQFMAGFPGQPFQRTDTTIQDASSASGGWATVNWGSIVMERAQLEWSGADWFNVRAGYWLTPYGIWNVDHGTPTLIALNVPMFVVFETFPARQLGIDLWGTVHLAPWNLEYHLYVSNGRTPGQLDHTDDKMLGGRLVGRTSSPAELAIGASAFYGRQSEKQVNVRIVDDTFAVRSTEVVAGSEWGIGGDVSLDVGPVRFRGEIVLNETRWDEGKHPVMYTLTQPSRRTWSTYGLIAYHLPWAGLEPYVYFEYNDSMLPWVSDYSTMASVGLNVHFTPATQLKVQYARHTFADHEDMDRDFSNAGIDALFTRLVVAF